MQKISVFICFLIFLVGCGQGAGNVNWNFHGTVVAKEDGRILVIDGVEAKEIEASSLEEMLEAGHPAAWFAVEKKVYEKVLLGDSVNILYEIMLESYPGQAEALKIEVVK